MPLSVPLRLPLNLRHDQEQQTAKVHGLGMAAEGQGRSTSSTDSVTGTSINTIFQLLRMCVVVNGDV